MATKFQLQPKPTFKADVTIPRAGEDDGVLTFTFKHHQLKQLSEIESIKEATAADFIMQIAEGWALSENFTHENVVVLLENYPRAGTAIAKRYYEEMVGNREKN